MDHDDDALILALLLILFGDPLPPPAWVRPHRRVRLRRRQATLASRSARIAARLASSIPQAAASDRLKSTTTPWCRSW